jgi:CHAP domain
MSVQRGLRFGNSVEVTQKKMRAIVPRGAAAVIVMAAGNGSRLPGQKENMEKLLLDFIQQYFYVPNVGDNPQNKGQCVGLIEVWLDQHKLEHIWGDAKDLLANADPQIYTVVKNGPNNAPPRGAIVVWDRTWGGGYGHTAICVASTPLHLAVFEQNDPDGYPPLLATHDYNGVAGWIVVP